MWQKMAGIANLKSEDTVESAAHIRVRADKPNKTIYLTTTTQRTLALTPDAAHHLTRILIDMINEIKKEPVAK